MINQSKKLVDFLGGIYSDCLGVKDYIKNRMLDTEDHNKKYYQQNQSREGKKSSERLQTCKCLVHLILVFFIYHVKK